MPLRLHPSDGSAVDAPGHSEGQVHFRGWFHPVAQLEYTLGAPDGKGGNTALSCHWLSSPIAHRTPPRGGTSRWGVVAPLALPPPSPRTPLLSLPVAIFHDGFPGRTLGGRECGGRPYAATLTLSFARDNARNWDTAEVQKAALPNTHPSTCRGRRCQRWRRGEGAPLSSSCLCTSGPRGSRRWAAICKG